MPGNAEPLPFAAEAYEYRISDSPCGPVLPSWLTAVERTAAMPASTSVTIGTAST